MELYATQDPESVMFVSIYDTEENSAAVWEKGKQLNKSIMNCTEIPTPTTNFFILKTTWTSDDPDGTRVVSKHLMSGTICWRRCTIPWLCLPTCYCIDRWQLQGIYCCGKLWFILCHQCIKGWASFIMSWDKLCLILHAATTTLLLTTMILTLTTRINVEQLLFCCYLLYPVA